MNRAFNWAMALGILAIIFCVTLPPNPSGIRMWPKSAAVQSAHAIGLAMFSYANDNSQVYADGKSSTEVFQKLLDGGYVSDPAIFYIAMAGKTAPVAGQKLKPENVSWDVIVTADSSSPEGLPLLLMTGYKISAFAPGASAIPLVKPFPRFGWASWRNQTWFDWLLDRPTIYWANEGGAAVFYKNNSAAFKGIETAPDGTTSIPKFIPLDYKPDGKVYRQLTPDGPLAP